MKQNLTIFGIAALLTVTVVGIIRLKPEHTELSHTTDTIQINKLDQTLIANTSASAEFSDIALDESSRKESSEKLKDLNPKEIETKPEQLKTDSEDSDLWQPYKPNVHPEVFEEYQNDLIDRRYFEFKRSTITNAKVGDTLSVYIPHAEQTFYIAVDDIETYPNGDLTLHGWTFNDQGVRHPVTLTQGAKGMFGNLSTPNGAYTIEAVDNEGWIAPTSDIRNQQNFNVPDFVVPDLDSQTGKLN